MTVSIRTVFREHGGARTFLDLSWSGVEVEVVTGKLGTAGLATSKTLESEEERDAWIEARVRTVLRQGYVEGSPRDVPESDTEEEASAPGAREAERLCREYGLPAFLPVFSTDDTRDASKLGGAPWADTPWPVCPTCTQHLRFVSLGISGGPDSTLPLRRRGEAGGGSIALPGRRSWAGSLRAEHLGTAYGHGAHAHRARNRSRWLSGIR